MTDHNWLLDAVDKLTLKHITKVSQSNEAGISCISEVDHDPLLLQLRDAVAGGIGSHSGSSSPRERIPFDPGALRMWDEIVGKINAWYRDLPNAREERHIHDRLRDWYIDYSNQLRAGKISDTADREIVKLVEGWVRLIEAIFDPPITLELTDEDGQPSACPECGARYAIDPKTGDRITSLGIEYRNLGVETMEKATGLCRSCGATWRGGSGLRAMRWAVDNEVPPTESTVGGYTTDQLKLGITSALSERNMKAVSSLLGMLTPVEPDSAAALKQVIDATLAEDARLRATNRRKVSM